VAALAGASTRVISAIFSGSPDAAIKTS